MKWVGLLTTRLESSVFNFTSYSTPGHCQLFSARLWYAAPTLPHRSKTHTPRSRVSISEKQTQIHTEAVVHITASFTNLSYVSKPNVYVRIRASPFGERESTQKQTTRLC